jgi:replication factor A1
MFGFFCHSFIQIFRSKIQCTLFGNYVDELNAFLGAGDCNNAVVIMQFAKAKNFQGFHIFKLKYIFICLKLIYI